MKMLAKVWGYFIEELSKEISIDKVKACADRALDRVETAVEESPSKLDDMLVLPAINKLIRQPFGIEDNDAPAATEPPVEVSNESSPPQQTLTTNPE